MKFCIGVSKHSGNSGLIKARQITDVKIM